MKAKELRIGNLVTVNNEHYHPKLKGVALAVMSISDNSKEYSIGLEHVNQKQNKYYETYSQFIRFIEPIIITKEWLLKFGFNNKPERVVWSFNMPEYDATIQLWQGNNQMSICRSGIAAYHFPCKYVHQLQNIYFALTGEELTIKIPENETQKS